jgi:hypothetical protein
MQVYALHETMMYCTANICCYFSTWFLPIYFILPYEQASLYGVMCLVEMCGHVLCGFTNIKKLLLVSVWYLIIIRIVGGGGVQPGPTRQVCY